MKKTSKELRNDIFLSMELLPNTDTTDDKPLWSVSAECYGCPSRCVMNFTSPVKLSFAFGAKLVGAFSSLCAKLDAVLAQNHEKQDGQKQAELFADGGE